LLPVESPRFEKGIEMKKYQITIRVIPTREEMTWTICADSITDALSTINPEYLRDREVIGIELWD
jgi:hypothetical protein